MNHLLMTIGWRRLILAFVWWSFRPWPTPIVPKLVHDVLGPNSVGPAVAIGWLVMILVVPTVAMWWAICIAWSIDPALRIVGTVATLSLDVALFWFNWRIHIRQRLGGPNAIARQIERFPAHERGAVQALLDDCAACRPNYRDDGRFTALQLLDLSDGDLTSLRRFVAIADRDPRDLQEWRTKRLLLATL